MKKVKTIDYSDWFPYDGFAEDSGCIGCMSYLNNKPNEAIVEAATFIIDHHLDYDVNLMQEASTDRYYCLDHHYDVM